MIDHNAMQAARRHADEQHPLESCGLVIATSTGQQYVPCRNDAPHPERDFRINDEDRCRAEDMGEVVAIVHSHPDTSPRPSMADRVQAELHELPWMILGHGDTHHWLEPSGYAAPLLGRTFHHGILDCWQACADWYQREWGLTFEPHEREDGWWENPDAVSPYLEHFESEGFYRVDEPKRGDMLVMRLQPTYHLNHAAIYLGGDPTFISEETPPVFGPGPFFFHHRYGELARRDIYGHAWARRTELILRHKLAR